MVSVAPAAAASPRPAAAAAAAATYVVKSGDTLIDIARRHSTTTSALVSANAIANPNLLIIGQRLTIPASGGTSAAAPAATAAAGVHVVRAGDTIWAIAQRYGVSVTAVARANGITNASLILIGQRLTIPGAAPAVPAAAAAVAPAAPAAAPAAPTRAYAATGGGDGVTGLTGSHIVARNETLESIATRYGISVADLAAANGSVPPYQLWSSMRLHLSAPNRLPDDIVRCPVPGARFMNDYGFPRADGRYHAGNDMLAVRNTPVRAPVSGVVSFLTGPVGGNQFRLRGDDGNLYIGTHLEAFGTAGRVAAGDPIGTVGNSGNAVFSETHLHFEVHPDRGAAMNPYPLLVKACR